MPGQQSDEGTVLRLRERFGATDALRGAAQAVREEWTGKFVEAYTEPQRFYHDLSHVDAMLACYDRAPIRDEAVVLTIFFHDWVYDPLSKTNELDSAEVFERFAADAGVPVETRRTVRSLIEATISHALPQDADEPTKLFLDFDLEVLSRPGDAYDVYAGQIRKEYGHFEDAAYREGRAKVLENFLRRDRIYFSDTYAEREQQARENISAEIARLKV